MAVEERLLLGSTCEFIVRDCHTLGDAWTGHDRLTGRQKGMSMPRCNCGTDGLQLRQGRRMWRWGGGGNLWRDKKGQSVIVHSYSGLGGCIFLVSLAADGSGRLLAFLIGSGHVGTDVNVFWMVKIIISMEYAAKYIWKWPFARPLVAFRDGGLSETFSNNNLPSIIGISKNQLDRLRHSDGVHLELLVREADAKNTPSSGGSTSWQLRNRYHVGTCVHNGFITKPLLVIGPGYTTSTPQRRRAWKECAVAVSAMRTEPATTLCAC